MAALAGHSRGAYQSFEGNLRHDATTLRCSETTSRARRRIGPLRPVAAAVHQAFWEVWL